MDSPLDVLRGQPTPVVIEAGYRVIFRLFDQASRSNAHGAGEPTLGLLWTSRFQPDLVIDRTVDQVLRTIELNETLPIRDLSPAVIRKYILEISGFVTDRARKESGVPDADAEKILTGLRKEYST